MTSFFAAPKVIAILGVGLLGGSVAAALRQRQPGTRIIGIGRNPDRLAAATARGLLDDSVTELSQCDPSWDLVIVGTPVDRIVADVRNVAAVSRPGTVFTDVGSVKSSICRELCGSVVSGFVGSHPMAGSERNGFEAARADLFQGRVTVVTPTIGSQPEVVCVVREFWEALGSKVLEMSPEDHDRTVAMTSHVPHVVASALAGILQSDQRALAASGFRDTTRIALGDADLWVAILLSNASAILENLDLFQESLTGFRDAIRTSDKESLRKLLADAKVNRSSL